MAKDIVKETIDILQSGQYIELGTGLKHAVNAKMAQMINIGDKVCILKTGKVGTVTKKIVYAREYQQWFSPCGYTAIQVDVDGRKRNYSGRSLQILKAVKA